MVERSIITLYKTKYGDYDQVINSADCLKIYCKFVRDRVMKQNKNFLCCIIGATGTGKSYCGITLGEKLDPAFSVDNIVFSQDELLDLLNSGNLKRGSVILYDEIGVTQNARNWYSQTNKMLNAILCTFRHLNLIVFFTVPSITFVDKQARMLFHGIIETKKIYHKLKVSNVKAYFIRYSQHTGKIYNTFLGAYYKGKGIKLKNIEVPLASKPLVKAYEKKRFEFASKLYSIKIKDKAEAVTPAKPMTKKDQILELLREGKKIVEVTRILKVSRSYVSEIKNGLPDLC